MKKIFILVLLSLIINDIKSQYSIAPKFGISAPFFIGNDIKYYKVSDSFNPMIYNSGITFEYQLKGNHSYLNSGILLFHFDKIKYISIPLNLKISLGKKIKPYINFGIYNSFLIGSVENYKKYDCGINPGFGFQIKIFKEIELFLEYQKYYGIKTAYVEVYPNQMGGNDIEYYNNNFGFYNFGINYTIKEKK